MRQLLLSLGALPVLALGLGCHHVGGECDCAAVPGDSVNHNPHVTYHAANPVSTTTAHSGSMVANPGITVTSPTTGNFEPIHAPKHLPPK